MTSADEAIAQSGVRAFVIFDLEHDRDLFEELLAQSEPRASGFCVVGASEARFDSEVGIERAREKIREADQAIVICGEHTEQAESVTLQLRIAQEEKVPYFLLWGRRELMCKKPAGVTVADGMYSWTPEIIRQQLAFVARKRSSTETADRMARATRRP